MQEHNESMQPFPNEEHRSNNGHNDKKISKRAIISNMFIVKNSETILWEKLKNGETAALGEIYDLHIDVLFTYGMSHSKDRGYVMDCIHDLFVDLFKYRKKLSITDNIKYYLFKCLKRKINKKYNKKDISMSVDIEKSKNKQNKNYTKSYEEIIINNEIEAEKNDILYAAISSLTKKQRKGLYLRFNKENTYQEISEKMGVSVETARTIVYRAIKTLRKHQFNY